MKTKYPAYYPEAKWKVSSDCCLPRDSSNAIDSKVVGDPCIVWDEDTNTWRMFYFALGKDICGTAIASGKSTHLDGSAAIESWHKEGLVPFTNPDDIVMPCNWHKWWVVMDVNQCNRAARIDGCYWSLFVSRKPDKVIQVAYAHKLAGPWTVVPRPILEPGTGDDLDSLNCDTPTAYWFPEEKKVRVFYKGYPRKAQIEQPQSPFGSGVMSAEWAPGQDVATKTGIVMRPSTQTPWAKGWLGGFQLLGNAQDGWYALMNASPTPPEDDSHREPAPSQGGWAFCSGGDVLSGWHIDTEKSPFLQPDTLTSEQIQAGIGVNFWRHHLLELATGQADIYFNSGEYGKEQLYSLRNS